MSERFPWFAARLLFEARREGGMDADLLEERLVVIRADSGLDEAKTKAKKVASELQEEYANVEGESVTWRFVEVLDLVHLTETVIRDGSEVYFHLLTHDEVEQIRRSLKSGSLP